MAGLQKCAQAVSKSAAVVSAVILVCMIVHILVEIVLRSFFSRSTYVLDEFIGYGIAAMTFLSLSYSLENNALVRVNLVLSRLGGRLRLYAELACVILTASMTCFLVIYFWKGVLYRDFVRGTVSSSISQTPLWIPEGLVLVGLILFLVSLVAYAVRLFAGARPVE